MMFLFIITFLILLIYYLFFSASSQIFGEVNWRLNSTYAKPSNPQAPLGQQKLVFLLSMKLRLHLHQIKLLFPHPNRNLKNYNFCVSRVKELDGQKKIALTFDDGPNQPYTDQLLEILKKHQVRATFFVCGACVKKYPGALKKIKAAGHIIGNHSHRHQFKDYLFFTNYINSLKLTNSIIFNEIGETPKLYRSPWLFRTPRILKSVKSLGLKPIWGIFGCELEIFQPSPEFIAYRALSKSRSGSILIFHDGKESVGGYRGNTVLAIDILIPKLKERDFEFVSIEDN